MNKINLYRNGLILFIAMGLLLFAMAIVTEGQTFYGLIGLITYIIVFANYLGIGVYIIVMSYLKKTSRRAKDVD